ncbi:MerR family transcriptional regulator [Clostridium saccharoperbutylacetonicum]|uniref:MerR family transcriptional regulator n=1 Tax=Clostridium saccharoperbutylacetonicum TaxID=36745 RepID=UPI0039EC9810
MYKIGEFSKITKLTTKTLRYYDEEDILVPSDRHDNGYRLYNESDFKKAQIIVRLRELEFSIAEMKDLFNLCDDVDDIPYVLEEKRAFIEKRIKEEQLLIKKLNQHLLPINKEVSEMSYDIELKEVQEIPVASVRYKGKYSDVGKYIGKIYSLVKNKGAGAPFNCYYDEEFKDTADIELCIPTKELLNKCDEDVKCRMLPKLKGIATIHYGSYDTLNCAYKALLNYAKAHNLLIKTPSREIYIKGPGKIFKGNPQKYVTELIVPYEEQ